MAWNRDWTLSAIDPFDMAYWTDIQEAVEERARAINSGDTFAVRRGGMAANDLAAMGAEAVAAVRALSASAAWFDRAAFDANYAASGNDRDGWHATPAAGAPRSRMRTLFPAIMDFPPSGLSRRNTAARAAMLSWHDALGAMVLVEMPVFNNRYSADSDPLGGVANHKGIDHTGTEAVSTRASPEGFAWAEWGYLFHQDGADLHFAECHDSTGFGGAYVPKDWSALAPLGGAVHVHARPLLPIRANAGGTAQASPIVWDWSAQGDPDLPWEQTRAFGGPGGMTEGWNFVRILAPATPAQWGRNPETPTPLSPPVQTRAQAEAAILAACPGADPDDFFFRPYSSRSLGWELDAAYIDLAGVLEKT